MRLKSVKKPQLYTACNTLPIHNFNEVVTKYDYNSLKRNPDDNVSDADLQQAWLGILDEFIRLSNNYVAINMLKKKAGVIHAVKRLSVFEAIKVNISYGNDVSEICAQYKVVPEKIDSYIGMVKNDIARLRTGEDNMDGAKKGNGAEFDRSIAMILKAGYQVNRFTTVVSEWCAILQVIEQQNKEAKKNG